MKIIFIALIVSSIGCNDSSPASTDKHTDEKDIADVVSYKPKDLQKIKWISGNWKGMYNGKPFYEIYQFRNDTTLDVLSYDWNGKDSSNTSVSSVYWKDGAFYLGEKMNWKVSAITEQQIAMKKNFNASNDIIWKYNDNNSWDAYLESKKGTVHYHMERTKHF